MPPEDNPADDNNSAPIVWAEPAMPRHVVQMLVVDDKFNMLLLHRSANNKSAANAWAMPTGTHEVGETAKQTIYRELQEELSLELLDAQILTQYENIATDPMIDPTTGETKKQFHWIITIYVALVQDVCSYVNNEPDRHDEIRIMRLADFNHHYLAVYPFHGELQKIALKQFSEWRTTAEDFIMLNEDEPEEDDDYDDDDEDIEWDDDEDDGFPG